MKELSIIFDNILFQISIKTLFIMVYHILYSIEYQYIIKKTNYRLKLVFHNSNVMFMIAVIVLVFYDVMFMNS